MGLVVDLHPVPEPRPTLTHADCVVSTPLGYRPLHLDLHVPPGEGPFPVVLWTAVILWYGPADLADRPNRDDPFSSPAILLGGPLSERTALARLASPLHNIHPDAPPFQLVHGTADEIVPYAEAVGFAEALRAQGVRCDVLPVEGAGHVFAGAAVEVGALTEAGADFLDDVLGRPADR